MGGVFHETFVSFKVYMFKVSNLLQLTNKTITVILLLNYCSVIMSNYYTYGEFLLNQIYTVYIEANVFPYILANGYFMTLPRIGYKLKYM